MAKSSKPIVMSPFKDAVTKSISVSKKPGK
jgi:hypothetical protein